MLALKDRKNNVEHLSTNSTDRNAMRLAFQTFFLVESHHDWVMKSCDTGCKPDSTPKVRGTSFRHMISGSGKVTRLV